MDTSVLVVGAGPTGLTLAVDLARRGVSCRIVERADRPAAGSRGRGMQPRTLEVLDDLGVLPRVRAHGGPYPPIRAYQGGEVVWEGWMSDPQEPTPDVPYSNPLMIPQWRTVEILTARLAEFGVPVELGAELVGFEQDERGVTATLERAGAREVVRAEYLVGADGGRGRVRRTLGVDFVGETDDSFAMLVADVRADGLDREHWHMWRDPARPDGHVAMCPLAGTDSFQLTASLPDGPVVSTVDELGGYLDARTGRSDIRLHDLTWLTTWRPNVRLAERFRVGRVFLAGDAAHVHPPTGGQGLNTGIQDAYNLGWKLGAVLAGAPAELLDTYQDERMPVAADVLGLSARLLRRTVESGGDLSTARRGPETRQLGVGYRGGPLAWERREQPGGTVRAGDRAPDAPCRDASGAEIRLFDLFRGPHATLLDFGADRLADTAIDGRVRRYTVARPGDRIAGPAVIDTDGHARRGYGLDGTHGTLVLVRPDGYLGLVTTDPADVPAYLDRILPRPGVRFVQDPAGERVLA